MVGGVYCFGCGVGWVVVILRYVSALAPWLNILSWVVYMVHAGCSLEGGCVDRWFAWWLFMFAHDSVCFEVVIQGWGMCTRHYYHAMDYI